MFQCSSWTLSKKRLLINIHLQTLHTAYGCDQCTKPIANTIELVALCMFALTSIFPKGDITGNPALYLCHTAFGVLSNRCTKVHYFHFPLFSATTFLCKYLRLGRPKWALCKLCSSQINAQWAFILFAAES